MPRRSDVTDDLLQQENDFVGLDAQRADIARLPGTAAQLIGERMRTMYAKLVREPVPSPLLELVRQLETKERSE